MKNRKLSNTLALFLGLLPFPVWAEIAAAQQRGVFGWVENVDVHPLKLRLTAKLDTGATTSSLGAQNLEVTERDGAQWARFSVAHPSGGQPQTYEFKITRTAKIKDHGGGYESRPVIALGFCLGRIYKVVEVSLADRSNFVNPVLLGRNFLQGDVVVDSAQTFVAEPDCQVSHSNSQ